MAAGTSASFAVQAVVMLWMLSRRTGGLELSRIGAAVGKMVAASVVMWVACEVVRRSPLYPHAGPVHAKTVWMTQLLLLMAVGGASYFGACAAMGMNVMEHVSLRRKR
jgi:peptidoglycan biosynthesis protein MviN/MurJ (putative lipid II flippase)